MKYEIALTSAFKKQLKIIKKQNKKLKKLTEVINKLAEGGKLEPKYKDHKLENCKSFMNCRECHIEPDWLLVYRKDDDKLILLLIETGSHSELF